jgi:RHS repeat-associated protein
LVTRIEHINELKLRITNPRGHQTTTSFMAWDQPSYDLPVLSEQPENKVIQIARHSSFGWPLALTQRKADNSLSLTRSYVYDGYAQLCKTIEPETGATVTSYDAAGNLAWSATGLTGGNYASTSDCSYVEANASGRVASRTYDARNRLTALSFPDGRGNQAWTYEKDGLPASISVWNDSATTGQVTTAYTYNKRRLLAGESIHQNAWYTWAIGYSYDANGNLASQTYPTGLNIDYAPNALGQATKAGTYATGASYYPNGALKQFTYGNCIVHTMQQNARQLPARVTSSGGVNDFTYNYDANGNVTNIWDLARGDYYSRWLSYDNLDRLTAAGSGSFGGDAWHKMSYDALDNLKSWKLAGVKDYADYIYDAKNRLVNIRNTAGATVVGLDYDHQGNLSSKNEQAYEFDYGNRLRNVPGKESYRYDGEGRRVQTTAATGGATTLWQYGKNGQMLFSSSWDGPNYLNQQTREYVHLAGSTVAIIDHSWPSNAVLAVKYQHTDALGSPVAVTNASGQVIERLNYEPYGAIIGNPTRSGVGYTGHIMDGATGLTYMQQRYYDQSMGVFLSVDPITVDAQTGFNFNRYSYVGNNPYSYNDPDGRQRCGVRGMGNDVCDLPSSDTTDSDSPAKPGNAAGDGALPRVSVPSQIKVEDTATTLDGIVSVFGQRYINDSVSNDTEFFTLFVQISPSSFGYLTPGVGPPDETVLQVGGYMAAARGFANANGYAEAGWGHTHFDGNLKFSPSDIHFIHNNKINMFMTNRLGDSYELTPQEIVREARAGSKGADAVRHMINATGGLQGRKVSK